MKAKKKPTAGMRCEMARLRCKASDLGPGSMVDVRRIDREIQKAATWAMMQERLFTVKALNAARDKALAIGASRHAAFVIDDLAEQIAGKGAPTKGAVR